MKRMIYTFALSAFLIISANANTNAQTDYLTDYMTLKDAFVKSDVAMAKKAATQLTVSLASAKIDNSALEAATLISTSDNLAEQRTAFKIVTDQLISSLKAGANDQTVFVQYCPMAFDNTGASWLSLSQEIRNPYFGDMMLKCGSVKETLQ